MKILVKRSGGYAGLEETVAEEDTTRLDAATAQRIEQLVQSLGFFNLPAVISSEGVGADLFHYEITIMQGNQQHTVSFNDDDSQSTVALKSLVETISHMG